jgi:FtsH-binding integral membrane protein
MQPDIQYRAQTATAVAGQENKVLRNTYLLLAVSMIPTIIGAVVGFNTSFAWMAEHRVMGFLLMLGSMLGALFVVTRLRDSAWGVGAMLGFTFLMGFWLGPMMQYALHFRNGAQLIGLAAGATSLIFFGLATYVTTTRKDFSSIGKFLFVGLVLLVLGGLANMFFQVPAASLAMSAIAVILFAGYILYDVSDIIHGGETNYIMATVRVYMDIYNMFINLLNLLLALAGNRD